MLWGRHPHRIATADESSATDRDSRCWSRSSMLWPLLPPALLLLARAGHTAERRPELPVASARVVPPAATTWVARDPGVRQPGDRAPDCWRVDPWLCAPIFRVGLPFRFGPSKCRRGNCSDHPSTGEKPDRTATSSPGAGEELGDAGTGRLLRDRERSLRDRGIALISAEKPSGAPVFVTLWPIPGQHDRVQI